MTEKRKYNPDGPRKKPFYDTKRKVLVIPSAARGNDASGMDARGGEASGIPAAGERSLSIPHKYQHLSELPDAMVEQNKLALYMLNAIYAGEFDDPRTFAVELGINPYKFLHLADKNDFFKDCLEMSKQIITDRLVKRARTRAEDAGFISKILGQYDTQYRTMWEEMRSKEAQRAMAANITVIAEAIPDSNLVPKLKRRDDE